MYANKCFLRWHTFLLYVPRISLVYPDILQDGCTHNQKRQQRMSIVVKIIKSFLLDAHLYSIWPSCNNFGVWDSLKWIELIFFPSLRRLVKNVDFYEDSTIHNSRNKGKIKIVTSNSLHHDSILMAGSNFKLKSSLPRFRTSHLVTCTSMEHGNSLHAHTVYQMLVTHRAKFELIFLPKSYSNV